MTQLTVGGVALPESKHGYTVNYVTRDKATRMADNSLTVEVGGTVIVLTYSYDYFCANTLMQSLLAMLHKGAEVAVQYLDPRKTGVQSGIFICTEAPNPQYAFQKNGRVFWHGNAFTLESKEAS